MQASQTKINQEVAVALERLNGRMEGAEQRIKDLEDSRREDDKRRDARIEKVPDNKRADLAILLSVVMAGLYLLSLVIATIATVAQHWR